MYITYIYIYCIHLNKYLYMNASICVRVHRRIHSHLYVDHKGINSRSGSVVSQLTSGGNAASARCQKEKNYPLPTHSFHQKSEHHRKSTWCCPKGWYSQYTWSSHWVLGPFPERQHPASCTIPPPAWDCTPSPGLGPPRCTAAGARSLHPWSARRRS